MRFLIRFYDWLCLSSDWARLCIERCIRSMAGAEEALRQENEHLRREIEVLRARLESIRPQQHENNPNTAVTQHACAVRAADEGASIPCYACINLPATTVGKQSCQQQATGTALPATIRTSSSNPSSNSSYAHQAVHGLSAAQVERYSRQLLLTSFGIAAQGKLCSGSVLIVGCGGLGSPAALYLAAAGVGRLGLVDHDVVELSNMHRQISHTEDRLGVHKAISTAAAVAGINSSVQISTYLEGLQPRNAVDVVSQYQVVIDASDNAPTRYLINDACVACHIPLVSAAAVGTDGQLTVYNYSASSPCYRCLFPECPAVANCSRCADAGVLGPVPGVMGVLQALEAIKVVTGAGQPLAGKLLLYDALAGRFSTIKLRGKAPGCAACGEQGMTKASISSYDYAAFTGGQTAHDGPPVPLVVLPAEQRLTAQQAAQLLQATHQHHAGLDSTADSNGSVAATSPGEQQQQQQQRNMEALLLLDVRPPEQFAVMALPGAVNVPFLQFDQRFDEVLQLCGATATGQQQQQQQPGETPGSPTQSAAAAGSDAAAVPQCTISTSCGRRVVVLCRRGNHSQLAVERLRRAGVHSAVDVVGGYEAWAAQVDHTLPVL